MAARSSIRLLLSLLALIVLPSGLTAAQADPPTPAAATSAAPAAVSFDPLNVALVGHLGGQPQASAAQGNYAYVVTDSEVAVIDVSDAQSPRRVGYLALSELRYLIDSLGQSVRPDVIVQGDYLYLPITSVGVLVVDVATPTAPHVVGRYPTPGQPVSRLAVAGAIVYVVTSSCPECNDLELRVLDVADPTNPTLVGRHVLTPGNPPLITAQATLVYLAAGPMVTIIDATNPVSPTLRSQYSFPGDWTDARGLAVSERYLFIPRTDQSLRVLDVADPGQPVQVANFALSIETNAGSFRAPYLFLGDNARIDILDVRDPDAIQIVGTSVLPHIGLAVAGSWLGAITVDRLQLIDVADVAAPVVRGAVDLLGEVFDVAVAGHMVYAVTGAKLYTIDASDPARPVVRGSLPTPGASDLELVGSYAYVAGGEKLQVIDVSAPFTPTEIGTYPFPSHVGVVKMAQAGSYLYISYFTDQSPYITVLDISDPAIPVEVSSIAYRPAYLWWCQALYHEMAHAVIAHANRLYLTNRCELDILDITNPLQPTPIGQWSRESYQTVSRSYSGVAVYGDLIYVGVRKTYPWGGLPEAEVQVLDAEKLPSVTEMGNVNLPSPDRRASAWSALALSGEYLYVSGAALTVWRLADPAHPTQAGRYDLSGLYYGAVVADNTFYSGGSGLSILRFTVPTYVTLSGRVTQANGSPPNEPVTVKTDFSEVTTDATGSYTFTNVVSGTHTLTPVLQDHIFEPPQRTLQVLADTAGLDFVVLPAPTSIRIWPGVATYLAYTDTQGLWTQLDVPTNAVTQTMQLVLTPTVAAPFDRYAFAAHAFKLSAVQDGQELPDFEFGGPLGVTIHYSDMDVRAIDEARLALFWWTGSAWVNAEQTCAPPSSHSRNPAANVIRVGVCRTGTYALFGLTQRVYLPYLAHNP